MEDFPPEDIILTHNNGSRTKLKADVAISRLPVQFAVVGKSSSPGDRIQTNMAAGGFLC